MKFNLKTEYLFIILFFIMVPIFVWLLITGLSTSKVENPQTPTNAQTTPTQTNYPTIVVPRSISKDKVLYITSFEPINDTNITYSNNQPIQISFNNSVDPVGIKYNIDPQTDVVIKNGSYPNKILIEPRELWKNGLTTITILSGSVAKDGSVLYSPVTYQITTAAPSFSPQGGTGF